MAKDAYGGFYCDCGNEYSGLPNTLISAVKYIVSIKLRLIPTQKQPIFVPVLLFYHCPALYHLAFFFFSLSWQGYLTSHQLLSPICKRKKYEIFFCDLAEAYVDGVGDFRASINKDSVETVEVAAFTRSIVRYF